MRRVNDYPVVRALTPVRRIRRPETYDREPREDEHEPRVTPASNDNLDSLDDNSQSGEPGSLIDEFA